MRLLVADDEQIEREAITALLEREFPGECTWVGVAPDGATAARLVARHRPQVAILDIKMPGLDGLAVTRRIRSLVPYAQVILLTAHAEFPLAQQAIRLGVKQYLLKPFSPVELVAAVREAFVQVSHAKQRRLEGQARDLASRLAKRMILEQHLANPAQASPELLTECAEILDLRVVPRTVVIFDWLSGGADADFLSAQAEKVLPGAIAGLVASGRLVVLAPAPVTPAEGQTLCRAVERLRKQLQKTLQREVRVQFASSRFTPLQPSSPTGATAAVPSSVSIRLLDPAIVAQVLFAGTGPGPVLEEMEATLRHHSEVAQTDLIRWGFGLLTACREDLLKAGCATADVDRIDTDLGAELLSAATLAGFVAWADKALVCLHALYLSSRPGDSTETIKRIVTYLRGHYMEKVSLGETARKFGLSAAHLSRLFKQEMGVNFSQYLTDARLLAAKDLLTNATISVHLVSRLVGFQSHSYFCTVFKRQFGISPTDFRAGL